MNRSPRGHRILEIAALLLGTAPAVGQEPPVQPLAEDPLVAERRAWTEARERLDERDPEGFLAPTPTRIRRLHEFLAALPELTPADGPFGGRHRLRCEVAARLATLHLARRDGDAARKSFQRILDLAGEQQLDLRGRARFGIAQSYEAAGDRETARNLLLELEADPDFTGTRYSDWARSALSRLKRGCAVGDPAPDFGPRRDLSDQVRTLHATLGQPVLLLFGSAEDPDGLEKIDEALEAGARAGLSPEQMPLLLIDVAEPERALRLVAQRGWKQPVLPSRTAFIDRTLLDYRVATLPAWVLVGPRGRILSRDAPPHRIEQILRDLRRRR